MGLKREEDAGVGLGEIVGLGVEVCEAIGLVEGDGEGEGETLIEGLGVTFTDGFIEGFAEGEGEGVFVGSGVGLTPEGDGELVWPKTSSLGLFGKKTDLNQNPEPLTTNKSIKKNERVNFEGLLLKIFPNIPALYIFNQDIFAVTC